MLSDDDKLVATNKLEEIFARRGQRLNVDCVGETEQGDYEFNAWVGRREAPSGGILRKRTVNRRVLDRTSTSGHIDASIDVALDTLARHFRDVPSMAQDSYLFCTLGDAADGRSIAILLRGIVAETKQGMTTARVVAVLREREAVNSPDELLVQRVVDVLDHLTLQRHSGLRFSNNLYAVERST